MNPIVDYFSFTIPIPMLMTQWETADRLGMGNLFDDRTSELLEVFASQRNWREFKVSGRFPRMIRFDDIGLTYFEGEKSDVSLVQASGEGCEWIRSQGDLTTFLDTWKERTTRIDIAIDIDTDVDPEDFARRLSNKRFKTSSHEETVTGKTWYVGSYKSDRFARVYRYSDKLVRRGALRLEYQFGNAQAKHAAALCANAGVHAVAFDLGNLYGWQHESYAMALGDTKFKSLPRPKTRAGKEFWIYNQILPSLIKEGQKGNIDLLLDLKDKLCGIIEEYSGSKERL